MTREEAERIVRCFDEFRKNHSSACERELGSIQLRHPTVRFFDQYNRPTREFKIFVTNLRKFLREARKIEKLEKRQAEEFVDGIVVFGSCHLDVWGDVAKNEVGVIDQPGSVTYSVGGTAYNIAYNLRSRGLPIAIFSCIRAGSAVSDYILRRVREAGIVDDYIHKLTDFPESAFVAHRVNGELVSAVSSMAIETHGRFDKARVEEVIKRARVVVFECNLSPVQIELISRLAAIAKRPVLCAAVSEPKASRILTSYRTKDEPALLAACLNQNEFAAVAKKHDMSGSGRDVLEKLNCKAIFVTRGAAGYDLLSIDSTTPKHFPHLT